MTSKRRKPDRVHDQPFNNPCLRLFPQRFLRVFVPETIAALVFQSMNLAIDFLGHVRPEGDLQQGRVRAFVDQVFEVTTVFRKQNHLEILPSPTHEEPCRSRNQRVKRSIVGVASEQDFHDPVIFEMAV